MDAGGRVVIDGAQGEGGGQILRSALALAMVTGRPLGLERIRAKRDKPGLLRQHLTAVRAAEAVSGAAVEGAALGSTALSFAPGRPRGGDYEFSVGTAGSATLVAQTILPALMLAEGPSRVVLEGGTHNPFAPPFDFLDRAFLPLLRRMGAAVAATLHRPGFYPAGGGRFVLEVTPAAALAPLELLERGARRRVSAEAVVANLPASIAERELAAVKKRLNWPAKALKLREETRTPGPGNVLMVSLEFEQVTEVFTGFGAVGVSAETVAARTLRQVQAYLKSPAAVGPYLADQLLLPLALAGGGAFTTEALTAHAVTNMAVINRFLPVRMDCRELGKNHYRVDVGPA